MQIQCLIIKSRATEALGARLHGRADPAAERRGQRAANQRDNTANMLWYDNPRTHRSNGIREKNHNFRMF